MKTLEEQIAELRAREEELAPNVEKIESARAQRDELARLKLRVQRQENALRDAPHVEKAEAEHGTIGIDIAVVDTDSGAVIVKRPPHLVYQRFQSKLGRSEPASPEEWWKFIKPCIVYPDLARVTTITEERPEALFRIATACGELAQARAEGLAGK